MKKSRQIILFVATVIVTFMITTMVRKVLSENTEPSRPDNPKEGAVWYDESAPVGKQYEVFDGSKWISIDEISKGSDKKVRPLEDQLVPTKDEWKTAYGDTLETRLVYNVALMRYDQKAIFALVQGYHAADPNEVKK